MLLRVVGIHLEATAHHGHVRIGSEAGGLHANAQVGAEHAARAALELTIEERGHLRREGSVLGGGSRHGPHVSIQELVLDGAHLFDHHVVVEGEQLAGTLAHVSTVPRGAGPSWRRGFRGLAEHLGRAASSAPRRRGGRRVAVALSLPTQVLAVDELVHEVGHRERRRQVRVIRPTPRPCTARRGCIRRLTRRLES